MTKLTRRERTLLYAMFLILFAAGPFSWRGPWPRRGMRPRNSSPRTGRPPN